MAFVEDKAAQAEERKQRAERRKKAREDGLFTSLEGIEEYYLEVEGYTREDAEPLIIAECKSKGIDYEKKSWIGKRIDDAKVVVAFVKENPEEMKILAPMLVTAFTAFGSFALGAFSKDKDQDKHHRYNPPPPQQGAPSAPPPQHAAHPNAQVQPVDRTKVERLK